MVDPAKYKKPWFQPRDYWLAALILVGFFLFTCWLSGLDDAFRYLALLMASLVIEDYRRLKVRLKAVEGELAEMRGKLLSPQLSSLDRPVQSEVET